MPRKPVTQKSMPSTAARLSSNWLHFDRDALVAYRGGSTVGLGGMGCDMVDFE